jgi:ABC transporter with metal-binding/Fe-S-binding domain ATP-binding protein
MNSLNVGILFSGGKDSNYSLFLANKENYNIKCLISLISENNNSYMFQRVGLDYIDYQAKCLNIPILKKYTKGEKEKELIDLKKIIEEAKNKYNLDGIVTGAIYSIYQSSRIQKICNELDLYCFNPIWQIDEEEYINDLIKNNFKIKIIGIFSYPFTKRDLNKTIDDKFIKYLKENKKKYNISLIGEGGEFESFVTYSPLFKKKELSILDYDILCEMENSCIMNIKKIMIKNNENE